GPDNSPWLFEIQTCVAAARHKGASWALTGSDAERNTLLKRLGFWSQIPARIGFFFDGPGVPDIKRGTHVRYRPHGLTRDFKDLAQAFGFAVYEAPGEAEAELSYLNNIGVLDYIVTSDCDVFMFGAKSVIRSPRIRKNRDKVDVFTSDSLSEAEPERHSRAGFLFLTVMVGGDYAKGLDGCGITTAYALAKSHHAQTLWDIASTAAQLPPVDITERLAAWREGMRDELRTNRSGLMGGRRGSAADNLDATFPDISALKLYVRPLTTAAVTGFALGDNMHFWSAPRLSVPDIEEVTWLLCRIFDWNWAEIFGSLVTHVLPGYLTRQLIEVSA
ncbi:PIN domain-like protein, partial [Ephemerocybe angulata]